MTPSRQVFFRPDPLSRLARKCSTVRHEKVGDYLLLVDEHLRVDDSGPTRYSITRCRIYVDGSLGRKVSYGLSGFDDFESAREFGVAWCRDSTEGESG